MIVGLNLLLRMRSDSISSLSEREARSYTWCDQRFVSVNIAAPEPARKIVILEDFACWTLFFIFLTVRSEMDRVFAHV